MQSRLVYSERKSVPLCKSPVNMIHALFPGFLTPEEKALFTFKVSANLDDPDWPDEARVVTTMNDGLYLDRSRINWVKSGGEGRYSDHMETSQVQRGETRWIQVDFGSVLEVAEVIIGLFDFPWYCTIIYNCLGETPTILLLLSKL